MNLVKKLPMELPETISPNLCLQWSWMA